MAKEIVSAPGKLMLMGEHAIVYNRPCLVTAVDQRIRAEVELLNIPEFQLEATDVNVIGYRKPLDQLGIEVIPKGAQFVEHAIKNMVDQYGLKTGFRVTTTSEFSSEFGFGSSSAATVCTIRAISELLALGLNQKEIFDISYKTILDVQKKGSGFDIAAAIYGGTLYYETAGKVIEPLDINNLSLIVGYSGIKADTVSIINQVAETAQKYPEVIDAIYSNIEKLVLLGKTALLLGDWYSFGELMNINQGYLNALGVSNRKLEVMIYSAREAGAYGAKLSGAGGGDCMIALGSSDSTQAIKENINQVGGIILEATPHAEGMRVENNHE